MHPLNSLPKALSPEEVIVLRDAGATLSGDEREPVPAPVAGVDPPPASDIRVLLQSRLRMLSQLLSTFFGLSLPFQTLLFGLDPEFVWFYLLPECAVLAALVANAITLRSSRPRSLGWLRADELVCFGSLTIAFSWVQYQFLRGALPVYGPRGPVDLFILAGFWDFTWFVLIVAYGLFVPNTRRRCAAVVGVLAVVPLTMAAAVGLIDSAVGGLVLGQFLFAVGIHVALGSAFAIFAAGRDDVLRKLASGG